VSRARFGLILAAALIAICGALYLSSQRALQHDTQGVLLLPSLAPELDTVTEVIVRKGSATPVVTVHRNGDQWSVQQLGDYPADISKVHKVLLALSEAKIVEQKTSDPANYPIIGVEDPTQTGAAGAEVTLSAKDGKHILIIGKPIGEGDFVRRAGEVNSYSVAPSIAVDTEPKAWIDARLFNVPASSVQSVELKPATGPGYVLHRAKPVEAKPSEADSQKPKPGEQKPGEQKPGEQKPGGPKSVEADAGFALETVPAGRKALDAKQLTPSRVALLDVRAEDVAKASDIDFGKPTQAIFTLSDGNVLTLTGTAIGDKRWIEIQATKDPTLAAKAQNRAFELASYKYDAIFRPLEELLVPKETKQPENKPAPAGKSAPATKPGAASKSPTTAAPAPAQ
jgi:Domain of unknown function (DUF4340)